MTCERFEVAIERRQHGALEGPERAALEQHLSGCASCAAFRETVERTEATMTSMAQSAVAAVDWERIEAGVRRGLARLVTGFVMLVLVTGFTAALSAWVHPERASAEAWSVVEALTPVAVAYAVFAAWSARRFAGLTRGDDMIRTYRRDLTRRIRALRNGRILMSAAALLFAWRALSPDVGFRPRVAYALDIALVAALLAWAHLVKLPRLRRELAELDGAVEG